jgi:UDP-N-acetylmuramate dehydrogenase
MALGRGTNVLISDRGWPGLVVLTAGALGTLRWEGQGAHCGSGMLLNALVRQSVERGLSGLENLAGIPGSVGGAVVMNAGAFGQEIGSAVTGVQLLDPDTGERSTMSGSDLRFGYRSSALKGSRRILLTVSLSLTPGDSDVLIRCFRERLETRRRRHPLDVPSCGSVFKNPKPRSAGQLIEEAGLKGYTLGGVQVSPRHANFFVNLGGATAEEFRGLMAHVQKAVHEKTGVVLEPEVVFAGAFDTPLYAPSGRTGEGGTEPVAGAEA